MGEKVRAWAKILKADDGVILIIPEYGISVINNSLDAAMDVAQKKLATEITIRINSGEKLPPPIISTNNQTLGGVWLETEIQSGE